jgi:gliding motility-associated-like protein
VNIPTAKTYYLGFGADNSGILVIDGDTILQSVSFTYWGIYKYTFTKGQHLIHFYNVNFGGPSAIGFEIYDNTAAQIAAASGYSGLKLIYSTHQEIGLPVQEGDPDSTYSCPIGNITLNYCTPGVPLCSKFVDISLNLNNPAPACSTAGVDLTDSAITAGNPSSLTYTYWMDSLATIPLANPKSVTQIGTYYVEGSFNQCNLVKPVTVVVNSASTVITKQICPGGSYMGHTQSGTYRDTLKTAGGCDSLVTLNLTVSPKVNLGPDRPICAGDTLLLSPGIYTQYQWQDGSTQSQYNVTAPGTYGVKVTDTAGCSFVATVVITPGDCSLSKIPNTFTPNGDGVNDTWKIDALLSYPQCTVFIYNRWGQPVFNSIGYSIPWDGTYGGKPVPMGVYYYVINLGGASKPLSGFVTVIR